MLSLNLTICHLRMIPSCHTRIMQRLLPLVASSFRTAPLDELLNHICTLHSDTLGPAVSHGPSAYPPVSPPACLFVLPTLSHPPNCQITRFVWLAGCLWTRRPGLSVLRHHDARSCLPEGTGSSIWTVTGEQPTSKRIDCTGTMTVRRTKQRTNRITHTSAHPPFPSSHPARSSIPGRWE